MEARYSIQELVNIPRLRALFEEFSISTGFTTGMVSYPEQELLIATGWRDICVKFHRACPKAAECCKESNVYLTSCLKDLKELNIRPCGNGLVDGATPVIIQGMHLASLATGQVLLAPPDLAFHRKLAREYGYDEEAYLAALAKVPVVSEEHLKSVLKFLSGLAVQIAEEGLNTLQIQEASVALLEEIEQRKQAEQTLERERLLLTNLKTSIPEHVFIKDKEGRFLWLNDALSHRFGCFEIEEAIGKSDFDFFDPAHANTAHAIEQQIIATGQPVMNLEEREIWADGRMDWVSTAKAPLVDADGNIVGIVGINRDITLRKEAERILQQSEEEERHLNDILRAIRDIQSLIFSERDAGKLLQGVCETLTQTRGYLAAWVGAPQPGSMRVKVLAHAGQGAEMLEQIPVTWDNSPHGQGPCGTAIRERVPSIFNNLDSDPRFALWAVPSSALGCGSIASFPILYHEKLFGALTVKADQPEAFTQEEIVLLKGMVDEIAHALQSMEHEAERLKMEAMWRQSQKMEAIGQLAGGVAHDFNNILGAQMLQLSLMKEDPETSPQMRTALEELEMGANRASSLTRQLLMFSRQQAAHSILLDMNEVMESMHSMLHRILGDNIQLTFRQGEEKMWVKADKGMMEQVIVNLCVNARDAMPAGGEVIVSIQAVQIEADRALLSMEARPGKFICLSVADSGCGIPPEKQNNIFEPFYTTKEAGKGTGLGLSTVYGIVQQHRGWIEVESQMGQGALFQVFLPVCENTPSEESRTDFGGEPHGRETILLAEDDVLIRQVMARGLKHLGYTVVEACDGAEALREWEKHKGKIALLLTDMVMPGNMSGLDLTRQLRAKKPGLKTIISSGYSRDLATDSAINETEKDLVFLGKPYLLSTLAKTLRHCLDRA